MSTPRQWPLRLPLVIFRAFVLCLFLHAAVFCVFDLLPDAAYSKLGQTALQSDALEKLRQKLGTEGPISQRYLKSLSHLMSLDFGKSLHTEYPVGPLIWERLKISSLYWGLAFLMSLLFLWGGAVLYCDRAPARWKRSLLRLLPITMIPQFVTAAVFAVLANQASREFKSGFAATNLLFVLSIALLASAILFNAAASTALQTAQKPFVLTYLSYGAPWSRVREILMRNILIQLLPLTNRVFLALVMGTVFSELAFDRPGFGSLIAEAVRTGDQPVAMAWILGVSLPLVLLSQGVSALGSRIPAQ